MKSIIIFIAALLSISSLQAAPPIDTVLDEIEQNNTGLAAFRRQVEAMALENRTGLLPHDPEVEFAYLWASPAEIGPRTNLSLVQSFDFPTAYGYRNRIADGKDRQILAEYSRRRMEIRLEAALVCIELIHANAMGRELQTRVSHARHLAEGYSRLMALGETNVLEYNKALLNQLNLENQAERNQVERTSLLAELQRLNGGLPVEFEADNFPDPQIPLDFEQWFAQAEEQNPVLQWISSEVEVSQSRERLMRAQALPGISAGYVSEALAHEQFRGFAVGVSIPLWENRNAVKTARAQTLAARELEADQRLQFYHQLKAGHHKTVELYESTRRFSEGLAALEQFRLLEVALTQGEISLLNFLTELGFLYQGMDRLLDAQKELHISLAILNQYR
jgi:outer membrane protein, heavy metal efflux system